MNDDAELEIDLIDGVKGPARSIKRELSSITDEARSTEKALQKAGRASDRALSQATKSRRGAAARAAVPAWADEKWTKTPAWAGTEKSRKRAMRLFGAQEKKPVRPAKVQTARREKRVRPPREVNRPTERQNANSATLSKDLGVVKLAASGLAVALGAVAFKLTESALGAVKFRSEALTGLELITGSASAANGVFKRSLVLSDQLGQEWQTTVGGMQKLLGKGFDESFATDLTKGIADLSVVAPDANVSNLLLAIGQIKTAGKLQGDELNQLTEAGLNSSLMFDQLSKRLGKSRAEVLKLKESGKLMADDVLPAILDSIQAMTGQDLGKAAEKALNTTAGKMRRLEQLPGRIFLGVSERLDASTVDGPLDRLLEKFGPGTEGFEKGVDKIVGLIDKISLGIDRAVPLVESFSAGFDMGFDTSVIDDLLGVMSDPNTAVGIELLGYAVGLLAEGIGGLAVVAADVANAFGHIVGAGETMVGWAEAGKDSVAGFVGSLFGGRDEAFAAGASLGAAAVDGARSSDGIEAHSPSRKFMRAADDSVDGFATLGSNGSLKTIEGQGARLGRSAIRGTAQSLPSVSSGSGGGSSSTNNWGGISIPMQVIQENASNPAELERMLRRMVTEALQGIQTQGAL